MLSERNGGVGGIIVRWLLDKLELNEDGGSIRRCLELTGAACDINCAGCGYDCS